MQQAFDPEKISAVLISGLKAAARESHAILQLPKAWAMTGAFSLLTLALKLAQYPHLV
jgi:hypothetical protein